ncbi:MAG: helix-turn-helix domain-containing protein [Eubacteriales bacterium]|nr:helix-turn-helix domain-containing protein [Eubacteriales bacterium]
MTKTVLGETLYTRQEAAEMLGVTTRSMKNYIDKGWVASRKIGGRWYFTKQAIKDFAEGKRPDAGDADSEMP